MEETLSDIIDFCEAALGENLQWLTDKFDLEIRQGDLDTKHRLVRLNEAWIKLAKLQYDLTKGVSHV